MSERKTTRSSSGAKATKKAIKKTATKAVAKKPAKKTTKKVTKKVAKKATKKVSKKTVKKTTKAPAKKPAKKVTKKTTKKVAKKAAPKTVSKTKKGTTKATRKRNVVGLETEHTIGKTEAGVTIFSRVRTDDTVMLVARFFGLAFVLTGIGLTSVGVGRTATEGSFLAAVSHRFDIEMQQLSATALESGNDQTAKDVEDSESQKQVFAVDYLLPEGELSGEVELVMNVEAIALGVWVRHRETKEDHYLGKATTNDQLSWSMVWDTEAFLDGDYELRTKVYKQRTSYMDEATQLLLVVNDNAEESPESEAETVVDEGSDIDSEADGAAAVTEKEVAGDSVEEDKKEAAEDTSYENERSLSSAGFSFVRGVEGVLYGDFEIVFALEDAAEALAILRTDSGKTVRRIPVTAIAENEWRYRVDTDDLVDGAYKLTHQVKFSDGAVRSGKHLYFSYASDKPEGEVETSTEKAVVSKEEEELETNSAVVFDTTGTLKGLQAVGVEAPGVQSTEMYLQRVGTFRKDFLGSAKPQGDGFWSLQWDTTKTPNGAYTLIITHGTPQGTFVGSETAVTIFNPSIALAPEQEEYVQRIEKVSSEVSREAKVDPVVTETLITREKMKEADVEEIEEEIDESFSQAVLTERQEEELELPTGIEPEVIVIDESELTDSEREVKALFRDREDRLRAKVLEYSKALRAGGGENLTEAIAEFEAFEEEVLADIEEGSELEAELTALVRSKVGGIKDDVERAEEIIARRATESSKRDSDRDGVSDFDEVSIYKTNPFSADSDGDGFTDEAEILGGFNPNDAAEESVIAYESPKETVVVREDILVVESVVADTPSEAVASQEVVSEDLAAVTPQQPKAPAIISGKGLPNSFVTVYIFSTPIVATVRTGDDGSWTYRFDKDLEDGAHEVYVGVTDNTGKIVARSNPFTFVKEAQAFTPVDAANAQLESAIDGAKPSLTDNNSLLVAGASMVMALGFVLLLVSSFHRRRADVIYADDPIK